MADVTNSQFNDLLRDRIFLRCEECNNDLEAFIEERPSIGAGVGLIYQVTPCVICMNTKEFYQKLEEKDLDGIED